MLDTTGHPALLWSLRRSDGSRLECVQSLGNDEQICVQIARDGETIAVHVFGNPADAIRWAAAREYAYIADGWTTEDGL